MTDSLLNRRVLSSSLTALLLAAGCVGGREAERPDPDAYRALVLADAPGIEVVWLVYVWLGPEISATVTLGQQDTGSWYAASGQKEGDWGWLEADGSVGSMSEFAHQLEDLMEGDWQEHFETLHPKPYCTILRAVEGQARWRSFTSLDLPKPCLTASRFVPEDE